MLDNNHNCLIKSHVLEEMSDAQANIVDVSPSVFHPRDIPMSLDDVLACHAVDPHRL